MADADQETFREIAWRDFMVFAVGEPDMRAAFEKAKGFPPFAAAKNGLEAMIDKATGIDDAYMEAFMLWATEYHWGIDEAPEKVRALFPRRAALAGPSDASGGEGDTR